MKKVFGLLLVFIFAACVMMTWASPPVGVTPTLLARGTYDRFRVKADRHAPFDFVARAKPAVDMVVRTHAYTPAASTGWHTHPGPVFITVVEGQVTFYEYDDPSCTPTVVSAGQGYVDTGRGHIGRNETGQPARDVTVIIAPVGGLFRGELASPGPFCAF
jgi:hypothetical protein